MTCTHFKLKANENKVWAGTVGEEENNSIGTERVREAWGRMGMGMWMGVCGGTGRK
jgi:hypothetical protein